MPAETTLKSNAPSKYLSEVARKVLHMCSFLIVLFIYFTDKITACLVIGVLLLLLFIGNTLILSSRFKILNDIKVKYFSFLLRDNEKDGYISSNWFLLGCFLCVFLFPKYAAMSAITVLIFGDAFAALIGMKFGKHKFKNGKSLEGTLGFTAVSFLCVAAFMIFPETGNRFIAAAAASVPIAAIAELYSKQIKIDDNLTIPLTFGFSMAVFLFIFEKAALF
ncbi:MAG: hypothetical protein LBU81_03970 [Methanosarcinales archaeon]|jgi:dolichol kinase|nr:hypothetical protein [Methanosarcinales archaeon]